MKRNQLRAPNIDRVGYHQFGPFKGDRAFVHRQTIESGTMKRGKAFEQLESVFFGKHL